MFDRQRTAAFDTFEETVRSALDVARERRELARREAERLLDRDVVAAELAEQLSAAARSR